MRQFLMLGFLWAGCIAISGCDALVTAKPICEGQKLVDLSSWDRIHTMEMSIGDGALPPVPVRMERKGTGLYQISIPDGGDDGKLNTQVCEIDSQIWGAVLSGESAGNQKAYMVFRIEDSQESTVWQVQTADTEALKKAEIPFTAETDDIQGTPVQEIRVDPTSEQVLPLMHLLHDETDGLRFVLRKK